MDVLTRTSQRSYTRIAGALYLIIIVCGIYSEAYVRSSIVAQGDPAATAANILASTGLFRTAFVADSLMLISDVAIAILFYVLFKPVSQVLSLTAAAFRLTQAAVLSVNLLFYYASYLLLTGAGYSTAFEGTQLNALVLFLLDMHSYGYDLGLIFFGLSSGVLGYLVIKSDDFPPILGYGLIAAGVVYLLGSYIRFLAPDLVALLQVMYIVPLVAELAFCLWLLLKAR